MLELLCVDFVVGGRYLVMGSCVDYWSGGWGVGNLGFSF